MKRSDYVKASEPKLAALTGLFPRKLFVRRRRSLAWMPEPAIYIYIYMYIYIIKLRHQCCLFFFQFNLSAKPATQIHILQTNNESEILTNSDFWQIKVVRTEHVSRKISTFIQSGFLTNKSRPNPTFTIGQKSWLDKSTVSDHFYWSKVNIALAGPVKKNMWILSIRDICT